MFAAEATRAGWDLIRLMLRAQRAGLLFAIGAGLRSGVLVSRMTSDVDALQEVLQTGLLVLVGNRVLLLASVVVLTAVSWPLRLVCLLPLPFLLWRARGSRDDPPRPI